MRADVGIYKKSHAIQHDFLFLKEIYHLKLKILYLFTHPHVVTFVSDTKGDILKNVHTAFFHSVNATVAVKLQKDTKKGITEVQDTTKNIHLEVNTFSRSKCHIGFYALCDKAERDTDHM